MSSLDSALVLLAVLAGVTGTWSPCGLSTIETLRAGGVHRGGRVMALATTLAFALGALAGALTTFGLLGLLGAAAHTSAAHTGAGGLGPVLALVIAVVAAVLEASGRRVFPQVRRQVPEPWRRRLPVGVAAALYGALLGLGFTTFVMSFAVWALAGMSVALGSVRVGLLIGLGFGLGRALPVVALAPIADLELGQRILASMTQRASLLRGLRVADALALALCASLLAPPAGAADYAGRVDPSVAAEELAWQEPGVGGFLSVAGNIRQVPGENPALGGGLIAWRSAESITIADRLTLAPRLSIPAPGADLLAVSNQWLIYRMPPAPGAQSGVYALFAVRLSSPVEPAIEVAAVGAPAQIGRPALEGDTVVFHLATPGYSQILAVNLANRHRTVLRGARFTQLLNPSLQGGRLLYVRVGECRQQLMLGPAFARSGRRDRTIASRPTDVPRSGGYEPGAIREGRTPNHCIGPSLRPGGRVLTYWTTALSPTAAFLTVLESRAGTSSARVLELRR
ncbi:MAG: hypothetical protein ACHQDY_01770 [Solirubrobacterales bacterium]